MLMSVTQFLMSVSNVYSFPNELQPRNDKSLNLQNSESNKNDIFTVKISFLLFSLFISSPEQSSRRAIVLPPASALALALASASTNVKVLR